MVTSNMCTARFALAILTGTKDEMLADGEKNRPKRYLNADQIMQIESETDRLIRDLRAAVEESYGTEVLTLSVACRCVAKILMNKSLRCELKNRFPELLRELEGVVAAKELDSKAVASE